MKRRSKAVLVEAGGHGLQVFAAYPYYTCLSERGMEGPFYIYVSHEAHTCINPMLPLEKYHVIFFSWSILAYLPSILNIIILISEHMKYYIYIYISFNLIYIPYKIEVGWVEISWQVCCLLHPLCLCNNSWCLVVTQPYE